jgi:hypothetical protein
MGEEARRRVETIYDIDQFAGTMQLAFEAALLHRDARLQKREAMKA